MTHDIGDNALNLPLVVGWQHRKVWVPMKSPGAWSWEVTRLSKKKKYKLRCLELKALMIVSLYKSISNGPRHRKNLDRIAGLDV